MTVSKKCDKCGKLQEVEPAVKECSCGGVLKRIFNKDSNLGLGDVREDQFCRIDRMMLDSVSPKGHTRSVI